jgi:hypothetical protein
MILFIIGASFNTDGSISRDAFLFKESACTNAYKQK